MSQHRRTCVPLTLAALVALAACSADSIVSPAPAVEPESPSASYDWTIARLATSPELSRLQWATPPHVFAEAERMIRGEPRVVSGSGPRLAPPPVNSDVSPGAVLSILFNVTILLYQNGFFADATGDLRLDRAVAIIHPIQYAVEGVISSDSDQTVAGLEATIEWYEQRNAEGLVPDDITQWIIDYANIGIDKSGGSNATMTMCLSSEQRSCVTATLASIRWDLASFQTRLTHDFSYTFLDGAPAQVAVRFRLATGAPDCNLLGSPIATSGDVIATALVRKEPGLTANPNNGGTTGFGCVPHGVIRGFRWDGIVVGDANGEILESCGKSSGNPCFEPED